jgi:dynactin 1
MQFQNISEHYENAKKKLEIAEDQIVTLKENLEVALESETMIERLSEKNMTLEEKVDELQIAVEELEALKEIHDELEEQQIETEKALRLEIENKTQECYALERKIETLEFALSESQVEFQKYRDLVKNLGDDLNALKAKETSNADIHEDLHHKSQEVMNLNYQLQNTLLKSQAKQIEFELRKLESALCHEQLKLYKVYLPDTFFQGDNLSVDVLLILLKISSKSSIVNQNLDGKEVAEIKYVLSVISAVCDSFYKFISKENAETFLELKGLVAELKAIDDHVHGLVKAIQESNLMDVINLSQAER